VCHRYFCAISGAIGGDSAIVNIFASSGRDFGHQKMRARRAGYFESGLATTSGLMMMMIGAAFCSDCEVADAGAWTIS
jgi:hypothetical protein